MSKSSHRPPDPSPTSRSVVGVYNPNVPTITSTYLMKEERQGVGHRVVRARFHEATADAVREGLETQARDHMVRKALLLDDKKNELTFTLNRRYPHWVVDVNGDPSVKFGNDFKDGASARYRELIQHAVGMGWKLVFDEGLTKMTRSDEKAARKKQRRSAESGANALLKAAGHKSAFFRKGKR